MIIGQRYKDGTVLRCSECGDSKNPRHGHMVAFDDGGVHCFRCGFNGTLPLDALLRIALQQTSVEEELEEHFDPEPRRASYGGRPTALDRYAIDGQSGWDSFQMRDANGEVIGWHNRKVDSKMFTNEGQRGIGYVGTGLVSSPSSPIVLVEGVYDCITERHVCMFGTLSNLTKYFKLQWCWLWPDPDILDTPAKRKRFTETVVLLAAYGLVNVMGVIVSDQDPDEATVVEHYTLKDWMEYTK